MNTATATEGKGVAGAMTPAEVALIEEARIARAVAEVALEFIEVAGGTVCWGGEGSWQNEGRGLGLRGPVSDEDLDRLCAFLEERGGRARIDVCPFADETLFRGLAARGFVVREFENVLCRELGEGEDFRALLPGGWPTGPGGERLVIEDVDKSDEGRVREFAEVSQSGFRPEGEAMGEAEWATMQRMARHPRMWPMVARFGEEAVGGGAVEAWEVSGALIGTSVTAAFRGRGVQQALMAVRMERARDLGCRLVTIGSAPGIPTERNAWRLGFRVAYTKALMERRA